MNSEKLRELIGNCLQAAQSAREGLNKAMQSIDMAGKYNSVSEITNDRTARPVVYHSLWFSSLRKPEFAAEFCR